MRAKRFIPCAACVLGLLGLGGQVLGEDKNAATWVFVAAVYFLLSIVIAVLRNRIAAWWSSSILLPCGCSALLLFAGLNALARVDCSEWSLIYTDSTSSSSTSPEVFIL